MRNRIRTLRKQRHLTLAQLSKLAGVPVQTICNIELRQIRNPSYGLVTKLAAALGVPERELFAAPKPTTEAA